MRSTIFISVIFFALLSSCDSPTSVAQFYQYNKGREGVVNFKLPGWLVWTGSHVASWFTADKEKKMYFRLARKVKKMRMMVVDKEEGMAGIPRSEINSFVSNIRSNGYDDLFMVQSEGAKVNFLIKEKKDKLHDIVLVVDEADSFVFFDIKSSIRYKDLSKLIHHFMEKKNWAKEEEVPPAPPVEEKPKETKPRA
ncbi:MAG TPA: DUF4252 domain-containing protein [Saprospiraceae bacterium]|nr:DUF4252 domain-containing protein [Saprospiraceae bacterium]HMQ85412.1 DUF4252 domain-containing protein [Saprospiraceae bacterium]